MTCIQSKASALVYEATEQAYNHRHALPVIRRVNKASEAESNAVYTDQKKKVWGTKKKNEKICPPVTVNITVEGRWKLKNWRNPKIS
jgi:hypothetical protein